MASNDMRGAGPPVNVATASESRLRSVPGIGEARARSLLEIRRREPLTQEVLLAMPNIPANFWREKLESEPPEVCCDPEQPDLESTTTEISDIASSHSNTKVKLEPAAEDSTTTGFRQIAQVLTMMEKSMRESQEKILGALMASQERHDQQMLEVMAVLSQRGVASGGPETLLQSSAALPRKPLKSTKVDNDTFFQDHFAPEEGTGMMGSDAQLFSTIEKRQNRPPRSTLEPPAMNDGVNVLYEGEDCGGKQVRDPWRHHRPRQERHHWTETRKQQTTNEDRSGSIKQPLRLVSYFTSPSTPPIVKARYNDTHYIDKFTYRQLFGRNRSATMLKARYTDKIHSSDTDRQNVKTNVLLTLKSSSLQQ
ncbi:hypothetical protein CAPTEDRAFT_194891 [Capitella teleta]|uniref:Uncharacterized protein n=1 Tax=Capitella teleta TaxID=283909 RepID=R7TL99_CAPTE|nr:hypothetical protein CAPTEDRAFT_194891 [Capitella teleta]|eukprot:ELT94449.1 hypothetical protein CAPTEDRAFT_194891 [Capitella teleta]